MLKKVIVLSVMLIIISACEDETTAPQNDVSPVVESLRLIERWNINNTTNPVIIEIKLNDPQGFKDLRNVYLQVVNTAGLQVFEDSLYDDGNLNGSTDIIAGDGVFRNRFLPSSISSTEGTFTFDFEIKDKTGNSAGIFQKDVIFAFNSNPVIDNVISIESLQSGAGPQLISVTATDADGLTDIKNVYMDVLLADQSVVNEPYKLLDDGGSGNSGDLFAGDSIFSITIDSTFAAAKLGTYTLRFFAEDQSASQSNVIDRNIQLENEKSTIISSEMPDAVTRPAAIPIRIGVRDPQGLSDIQRVYFELQASDGSFVKDNQGNNLKINLFDDGDQDLHGDTLADDGTYAVILSVSENNVADTYTFYFYALDKVNNLSQALLDTLIIN